MRILFATNYTYPPDRVGGSQSSTHDLCTLLSEQGHEVAVLATAAPGHNGVSRFRFAMDTTMGYPVYRVGEPARCAAELQRAFHPAVVVIQPGFPMLLAAAFLDTGVCTVVYLRDTRFEELGGEVRTHPRLGYLACSRFIADTYRERFGIEAAVLQPLVRPERYRVERTGNKVLFVNPHPFKGVETALHLAERRPDIPFLFIECWDMPDAVREASRERAARAGNVEWRASVLDMRRIYQEARMLIVPSLSSPEWEEAWARSVTEAQVSGIPVLATRGGGLPESVGPGGILVEPGANGAWEDALARVWDDPGEHAVLSQAALRHAARAEIQPEALAARFLDFVAQYASAGEET
ncbi:MAG: glycosyltransferase [Planctomycetota bacterium]|nr:glycosyltransferase [Planctomycetota bacterium]